MSQTSFSTSKVLYFGWNNCCASMCRDKHLVSRSIEKPHFLPTYQFCLGVHGQVCKCPHDDQYDWLDCVLRRPLWWHSSSGEYRHHHCHYHHDLQQQSLKLVLGRKCLSLVTLQWKSMHPPIAKKWFHPPFQPTSSPLF